MIRLFYNPESRRLRAGWRILLFVVLFFTLSIAGQTIFKALNGGIPQSTDYVRTSVVILIAAVAATLAVPLTRWFVDRRNLSSIGLRFDRFTLLDIVFGFVLSAAMAGSFFILVQSLGYVEVSGINWSDTRFTASDWQSLGASLAVMSLTTLAILLAVDIVVSWWEELVFRGYLLRNFIDGMGLVLAIIVSCVLYGAVHATNPNATALSSFIIMGFGLIRIYGFLSTQTLWLSFGMHTGWNFFQGPVFGFSASGNESVTLVNLQPVGPDWLSGGAFGPEGSVLILPVLAVTLVIMWVWTSSRRTAQSVSDDQSLDRVCASARV